jgi:CheY-like chemotaxis protein
VQHPEPIQNNPKAVMRSAAEHPEPASIIKRVLVVEDEPVVRSLVEASLESESCTVVSVTDGPSALSAALAEPPDLILLDLGLPGMAGGEVAQRLRAEASTASVPICYLTGRDPEDLGLPADGVIRKPFTPALLRDGLAKWLR